MLGFGRIVRLLPVEKGVWVLVTGRGMGGKGGTYFDSGLVLLVEGYFFIVEIDSAAFEFSDNEGRYVENEVHIHDCQNDIEVCHFFDCSFPIFDFDGILPISEDDDFPRPCLFISEVNVLSFDTHYESVDC